MRPFNCMGCSKAYKNSKELSNHKRHCKSIKTQRTIALKGLQEKLAKAAEARVQEEAEQARREAEVLEEAETAVQEGPSLDEEAMEIQIPVRYKMYCSLSFFLII
jgi:hypothetical protein